MQNKTTNNLLFPHHIRLTTYSDKIPKSEHYRNNIENLIGKPACLIGRFTKIHKETVCNTVINRILLENAFVLNNRQFIPIGHMWITVEKGFTQKNKIKQNRNISCSGFLYEYISKGSRNIGFKLDTMREIPEEK